MSRLACALACLLLVPSSTVHAARFVFHDRADGISCSHFDVGLGVAWPRGRPEGVDASGPGDNTVPYASQVIDANDTRRVVRLNVTTLVHEWWGGRYENDGLLVQMAEGSYLSFHSREDSDIALRPQLVLAFTDGRRRYVEPKADAALDCSSYTGLGTRPTLLLKHSSPLALRFDLTPLSALGRPHSADLLLVRTAERNASRSRLSVQRLVAPIGSTGAARQDGIARRYPSDAGIAADPDVLFADGFDAAALDPRWSRGMAAPSKRVEHDESLRFEPIAGPALRVTIPKGRQLGLDLRYRFKANHASEPDEIYFRYYLWFADDWLLAADGGKLPGLAGTYGMAAWGDRPWHGFKGWSLRGAYHMPPAGGHPARGRVMLGSYAYHAKADPLGQPLPWPGDALAALVAPGRWYCIEQRLQLNSPRREDGIFQVWLDGRLVLDRNDLRLRDAPDIHIEEVWMNFFHGGASAAPADMHAYIDGVVIARRYIGPLGR